MASFVGKPHQLFGNFWEMSRENRAFYPRRKCRPLERDVRSPVTLHDLPAAQGARPRWGSQPQMPPPREKDCSMWHLSPIARDTPCFWTQLSVLFLDGRDKVSKANWEQSQRMPAKVTGVNLVVGLPAWANWSLLELIHFWHSFIWWLLIPIFSNTPTQLEAIHTIDLVLNTHLEITDYKITRSRVREHRAHQNTAIDPLPSWL